MGEIEAQKQILSRSFHRFNISYSANTFCILPVAATLQNKRCGKKIGCNCSEHFSGAEITVKH